METQLLLQPGRSRGWSVHPKRGADVCLGLEFNFSGVRVVKSDKRVKIFRRKRVSIKRKIRKGSDGTKETFEEKYLSIKFSCNQYRRDSHFLSFGRLRSRLPWLFIVFTDRTQLLDSLQPKIQQSVPWLLRGPPEPFGIPNSLLFQNVFFPEGSKINLTFIFLTRTGL